MDPATTAAVTVIASQARTKKGRRRLVLITVASVAPALIVVLLMVQTMVAMTSVLSSGAFAAMSSSADCVSGPQVVTASRSTPVGAPVNIPAGMSAEVAASLQDAASRYQVSWAVLAGVVKTVCPTCTSGVGLSADGIAKPPRKGKWLGPMGIRKDLWKQYRVDGDGDGSTNPQDIHDAAPTAAAILAQLGVTTDPTRALAVYRAGDAADLPGNSAGTVWAPNVITAGEKMAGSDDTGVEGLDEARRNPVPAATSITADGTLARYVASSGTDVVSSTAGTVVKVTTRASGKSTVVVRADSFTKITYANLARSKVTAGVQITAGQPLGKVGATPVTVQVVQSGTPVDTAGWFNGAGVDPSGTNGSVFVVGDSITVMQDSYDSGWTGRAFPGALVTVNAAKSRHTGEGVSILTSDPAARAASTWVVALGTNDATGRQSSTGNFSPLVDQVMAAAADRQVLWVNVHRARLHSPQTDPVNLAVAQAASRYANLSIVDWAAAISRNPGEYLTDGIHPSTAGAQKRTVLLTGLASGGGSGVISASYGDGCADAGYGFVLPSGPMAQAALTWALGRVEAGARYVAGANPGNPDAMEYDCSTFTYTAYKVAGLEWNFGRSFEQFANTDFVMEVPPGQEQPGDLIFQDWLRDGSQPPRGYIGKAGIDHVGLVLDPVAKTMVHAANPTAGVTEGSYSVGDGRTVAFARVIDPGAMSAGSGQVFFAPVAVKYNKPATNGRNSVPVRQYPVVPSVLAETARYKDIRPLPGNRSRDKEWARWNPAATAGTNRGVAATMMVREFGFPTSEWSCLDRLWFHESSWGSGVSSPEKAGGVPQAFPANKLLNTADGGGPDGYTNPVTQIRWGLNYIKTKYETPCGAWAVWWAKAETGTGWY